MTSSIANEGILDWINSDFAFLDSEPPEPEHNDMNIEGQGWQLPNDFVETRDNIETRDDLEKDFDFDIDAFEAYIALHNPNLNFDDQFPMNVWDSSIGNPSSAPYSQITTPSSFGQLIMNQLVNQHMSNFDSDLESGLLPKARAIQAAQPEFPDLHQNFQHPLRHAAPTSSSDDQQATSTTMTHGQRFDPGFETEPRVSMWRDLSESVDSQLGHEVGEPQRLSLMLAEAEGWLHQLRLALKSSLEGLENDQVPLKDQQTWIAALEAILRVLKYVLQNKYHIDSQNWTSRDQDKDTDIKLNDPDHGHTSVHQDASDLSNLPAFSNPKPKEVVQMNSKTKQSRRQRRKTPLKNKLSPQHVPEDRGSQVDSQANNEGAVTVIRPIEDNGIDNIDHKVEILTAEGEVVSSFNAKSKMTPMQLILQYQTICAGHDDGYRKGSTSVKEGRLYTHDLPDKKPTLAKYLYKDICEKADQDCDVQISAEGWEYLFPRKAGANIANDVTAYVASHRSWSEERGNGRPEVLFQFREAVKRTPFRPPSIYEPLRDEQGRVYLNVDGFPIKSLDHMPLSVSTVIEGWEIEAICRLNPKIGDPDFRDRMAPVIKKKSKKASQQVDGRPSRQNINMRRLRARRKMRVLTWPEPETKTAHDQLVVNEMDEWGLMNNSTARLADLTSAKNNALSAINYGTALARAGDNALTTKERADVMEGHIKIIKKAGLSEDSVEVQSIRKRFRKIANTSHADDQLASQELQASSTATQSRSGKKGKTVVGSSVQEGSDPGLEDVEITTFAPFPAEDIITTFPRSLDPRYTQRANVTVPSANWNAGSNILASAPLFNPHLVWRSLGTESLVTLNGSSNLPISPPVVDPRLASRPNAIVPSGSLDVGSNTTAIQKKRKRGEYEDALFEQVPKRRKASSRLTFEP